MEATRMKVLGVISTAAMFLFLGASVPVFAQEEHQEEGAKPAQHEEEAKPAPKQEQTKPQKQEEQPKTAKQEEAKPPKQEAAKPAKQEQQQQAKTQQNDERNQHPQEAKAQPQQSQGQFARNGQKDSSGHVYNESHFGPTHHARFEANGGRFTNGRRGDPYGGHLVLPRSYPG